MNLTSLQKITIFENSEILLTSDATSSILYQEHFGSEKLSRNTIRVILFSLNSGVFRTYVIKVNKGSTLPPKDLFWVEKYNLMRLNRNGISRVAYVSPQNVFNVLEMEKTLASGCLFKIIILKNIDDVFPWLEQNNYGEECCDEQTGRSL